MVRVALVILGLVGLLGCGASPEGVHCTMPGPVSVSDERGAVVLGLTAEEMDESIAKARGFFAGGIERRCGERRSDGWPAD